jgi:hypothetical protein
LKDHELLNEDPEMFVSKGHHACLYQNYGDNYCGYDYKV